MEQLGLQVVLYLQETVPCSGRLPEEPKSGPKHTSHFLHYVTIDAPPHTQSSSEFLHKTTLGLNIFKIYNFCGTQWKSEKHCAITLFIPIKYSQMMHVLHFRYTLSQARIEPCNSVSAKLFSFISYFILCTKSEKNSKLVE